MAVIKSISTVKKSKKQANQALQALTAAALALPGLVLPPAQAAEGEVAFQYSHFQENDRNLFGVKSKFEPIEVESIYGSGNFRFLDRFKFDFKFTQDTWSGETPITTVNRYQP